MPKHPKKKTGWKNTNKTGNSPAFESMRHGRSARGLKSGTTTAKRRHPMKTRGRPVPEKKDLPGILKNEHDRGSSYLIPVSQFDSFERDMKKLFEKHYKPGKPVDDPFHEKWTNIVQDKDHLLSVTDGSFDEFERDALKVYRTYFGEPNQEEPWINKEVWEENTSRYLSEPHRSFVKDNIHWYSSFVLDDNLKARGELDFISDEEAEFRTGIAEHEAEKARIKEREEQLREEVRRQAREETFR